MKISSKTASQINKKYLKKIKINKGSIDFSWNLRRYTNSILSFSPNSQEHIK